MNQTSDGLAKLFETCWCNMDGVRAPLRGAGVSQAWCSEMWKLQRKSMNRSVSAKVDTYTIAIPVVMAAYSRPVTLEYNLIQLLWVVMREIKKVFLRWMFKNSRKTVCNEVVLLSAWTRNSAPFCGCLLPWSGQGEKLQNFRTLNETNLSGKKSEVIYR